MEKPEFYSDEHKEYLNELREEGETNMYGARPYLMDNFIGLTKDEASDILKYWMESF